MMRKLLWWKISLRLLWEASMEISLFDFFGGVNNNNNNNNNNLELIIIMILMIWIFKIIIEVFGI